MLLENNEIKLGFQLALRLLLAVLERRHSTALPYDADRHAYQAALLVQLTHQTKPLSLASLRRLVSRHFWDGENRDGVRIAADFDRALYFLKF